MRRTIFWAAVVVVMIAAILAGCRQAKKNVLHTPKGESITTVLLPSDNAVDVIALQASVFSEALADTVVVAQSCPGIEWRQRLSGQAKADRVSRADIILASLASAENDGAEILCLQGEMAGAPEREERLFAQAPMQKIEVAMMTAAKGPELTWKKTATPLQASAIMPAEILVCIPGEQEHSMTPAAETEKKEKDAKTTEFEWDPRDWVESIFADSRPAGRRSGEM